ncbi:hypothetical protein E4T56_gene11769 [Termitomyces sp. T112]|nr:hypothetical protein E4T56_gene11769 [Termitomyces sp. T112]
MRSHSQWGQFTRFECNAALGSRPWFGIFCKLTNIQWCSFRVKTMEGDVPSASPARNLPTSRFSRYSLELGWTHD